MFNKKQLGYIQNTLKSPVPQGGFAGPIKQEVLDIIEEVLFTPMRPCDCGCGRPVLVKPTEVNAKVYHMSCLERQVAEDFRLSGVRLGATNGQTGTTQETRDETDPR